MNRNWVLTSKFKDLTGITPEAVRAKLRRGEWLLTNDGNESAFVVKIGGLYYIDIEGYNQWVEQERKSILRGVSNG